jgi:hypothetical protein
MWINANARITISGWGLILIGLAIKCQHSHGKGYWSFAYSAMFLQDGDVGGGVFPELSE